MLTFSRNFQNSIGKFPGKQMVLLTTILFTFGLVDSKRKNQFSINKNFIFALVLLDCKK